MDSQIVLTLITRTEGYCYAQQSMHVGPCLTLLERLKKFFQITRLYRHMDGGQREEADEQQHRNDNFMLKRHRKLRNDKKK